MKNIIKAAFNQHVELVNKCLIELSDHIEGAAFVISEALKNGNKVLIFGNGGSAADAQHIAAEFVGRFVKEKKGLPAIALTTDTSAITAIANDYGYDNVFARQVQALANEGDVCIGISTSGNSKNVIIGIEEGIDKGCKIITLLGRDGG